MCKWRTIIDTQTYRQSNSFSREALLKDKAQYNWPPFSNQFKAAFYNLNTIFFFQNKLV